MVECVQGHIWEVRRQYIGVESFRVRAVELWDHDVPSQKSLDQLVQDNDHQTAITVTTDERDNDEYLDIQDEWLACIYCEFEIRGDQIQEIQYGD